MPRAKELAKTAALDQRAVIVHLKGSPGYAAWLERLHRKTHIPKTSLFRLAMSAWAAQNGHEAPPEI